MTPKQFIHIKKLWHDYKHDDSFNDIGKLNLASVLGDAAGLMIEAIEILQVENQMLVSACQNVLADAKARPGAYLYADLAAIRAAVEEDK